MTAQGFDHEAWDRMANAPLLNQGSSIGKTEALGGLTLADLEAAAAALPDTSADPVAFRAHPAMIDALRRRLPDTDPSADPFLNPFWGLRLHVDRDMDQDGGFIPMTADQERAWLAGESDPEVDRCLRQLVRDFTARLVPLTRAMHRLATGADGATAALRRMSRQLKLCRHRQREWNRDALHASQAHRSRRSRRRPGGKWARA